MYGSALARTAYGQGDYNRAMTYASGYYAAGGFFSKIGSAFKKVVAPVAKVVANPLVGTALSFVPGGGLISKGIGLAGKVLSSPVGKAAQTALTISGGIGAARSVAGAARGLMASPGTRALAAGGAAGFGAGVGQGVARRRRKKKKGSRRRSKRVVVEVRGARRVKRKRKGGAGKRVTFRTKDGRSVSFTRK